LFFHVFFFSDREKETTKNCSRIQRKRIPTSLYVHRRENIDEQIFTSRKREEEEEEEK